MSSDISSLLNPSSVAILGATEGANRVGGRVMHYMISAGFRGEIYPVNPKRETVHGRKAYASVEDLPTGIDCAVLAIPAKAVIPWLKALATKGVTGAVVFSSGFAEMGEEGERMQDELGQAARDAGIRMLGPNCLGAFNAHCGFMGTFSSNLLNELPTPGSVGVISQSGAFGAHLYTLAQARNIGLSYWITTGNEVNVTVADAIQFMAGEDEVNTIMVYAEGINDPDGLRAALAAARAKKKPVIFVKVGRTEAGARAAASHTASLAVSDVVVDALLTQYGAYRADTIDEMMDIAYACQMGVFPTGTGVGIMTMSGGVGVQMADRAVRSHMTVPQMPADFQTEIREMVPFAAPANPVDVTAAAMEDPSLMTRTFELMFDADDLDAIGGFMTPVGATPELTGELIACFDKARERHPTKPIALCLPIPDDLRRRYEMAGYMVYDTPDQIITAFAALAGFGRAFARPADDADLPVVNVAAPDRTLSEIEAKAVLAEIGLGVSRDALVTSAAEAVRVAADLGGPVVLKIASPDILHKTEIGGVLVGLDGADQVREGFDQIMARARTDHPDADLQGIIVSEMVADGVETVIGVQNDPTFGPVVMFGLGGIFVEVLKDVTFRLAPFSKDEAHRMIREIRGFDMLTGVRGQAGVDLDQLADALSRISVFAAQNAEHLESMDINPFRMMADGGVALDAVFVVR